MKITILDTCRRVTKTGKPYVQERQQCPDHGAHHPTGEEGEIDGIHQGHIIPFDLEQGCQ